MILPSLAVGLTLINVVVSRSSSHSDFVKRQTSPAAALAGATYLNSVISYEICQISQGAFAAAAALGGNATFTTDSSCTFPVAPSTNITSTLTVTGCPHYVATIPATIGGNTCAPQTITFDGHVSSDSTTSANFSFPSTNSSCAGVTSNFTLTVPASNSTSTNLFIANTWNLNCTDGSMTLSDPTLHLCLGTDSSTLPYFYSTTDITCSNTNTIYATSLMM